MVADLQAAQSPQRLTTYLEGGLMTQPRSFPLLS